MGQDAFMEPSASPLAVFKCQLYLILLGTCSALTLRVPADTVHGIEGLPLLLPVHYSFQSPAPGIQITWLLERPGSFSRFLLTSVNQSTVPDLEFQHKFTLRPPNASLLIRQLHFSDEGHYIVKINVKGNGTISASHRIQVTVDVPVTKPLVGSEPSSGVVEHVGNITLTCSALNGTRVLYLWLKDGQPVHSTSSTTLSPNNDTLLIAPVMRGDVGNYSCLAWNAVSEMESEPITPTIYYGPYGLTVNSDKGLKVGEVFTADVGEAILFHCSADSNPPNVYSWIRRGGNTTHIVKHGPHFEVVSDKVARKTTDYMCRAYNNVTGKGDETQFTVIITSIGQEKLMQKESSLSPLAAITAVSLFVIISMSLLFIWKKYQPHKVLQRKLDSRPSVEHKKLHISPHILSGHEDALGDFGIYEFVAQPDSSLIRRAQDIPSTVYEVIQHVPEPPSSRNHECQ
ncbi:HEPACAM family member 2 [Ambystoma mexicanum]|uniref:HEPACAM family member 2 n=1 Tax=Ambystoma mexicanum TaxID=8296 RepID=UPI0037E9A6BA